MAPSAVRSLAAALFFVLALSTNFRHGESQENEVMLFAATRISPCGIKDDNPVYFEDPRVRPYRSRLGTDVDFVVTRTIDGPLNMEFDFRSCDGVDCYPTMVWNYELCEALNEGEQLDEIGFVKIDDIVPMLLSVNVTCPIEEGTYKIRKFPNFYYEPITEGSRETRYILITTMLNENKEILFCSEREEISQIIDAPTDE